MYGITVVLTASWESHGVTMWPVMKF